MTWAGSRRTGTQREAEIPDSAGPTLRCHFLGKDEAVGSNESRFRLL
jgi:hypothetical protein